MRRWEFITLLGGEPRNERETGAPSGQSGASPISPLAHAIAGLTMYATRRRDIAGAPVPHWRGR